jgi:tRNA(fMet)-specific endonuclease VapC
VKYLLDANVISALVASPQGKVAERVAAVGERNVMTSIVVSAEVEFGVRKRGSPELARKVANVMRRLYVAPLAPPADTRYAALRLDLERRGELIGPNDMLIAAHAAALHATLVTDNEREFSRVRGLMVENWLRP